MSEFLSLLTFDPLSNAHLELEKPGLAESQAGMPKKGPRSTCFGIKVDLTAPKESKCHISAAKRKQSSVFCVLIKIYLLCKLSCY